MTTLWSPARTLTCCATPHQSTVETTGATKSQQPQYHLNRNLAVLLPRTCCRRQGGFNQAVDPLYHLPAPPLPSRAFWYSPLDKGPPKLPEFVVAQSASSHPRPQPPTRILSPSPTRPPFWASTQFLEYSSLYWVLAKVI